MRDRMESSSAGTTGRGEHTSRAFWRLLLCVSALLIIGDTALGGSPFPWRKRAVVLESLDAPMTADDVIANPFDESLIYAVQAGNSPMQKLYCLRLSRTLGRITGGAQVWHTVPTLVHNNKGLKSLDMYNADTIFYTLEQGGDAENGLVGRLTGLDGAQVHALGADLTGVRTGKVDAYDPEGIAIDRRNNILYVMTDDGPNTDVSQYSIHPKTLDLTHRWTTSVATPGSENGNDGIVLSDGRVAVVDGSEQVDIYAVSPDGKNVVNLLGDPIVNSGDTPQDLVEHGGHLYLFWEKGRIDAFDARDLASMSNKPVASWELEQVLGGKVAIGGAAVTADGHLMVCSRGKGLSSTELIARIFVFNAHIPIP